MGTDSNTVVIPGRTKLGKEVSKITKALINTLNPSRVFDLLDGHADFRGAWHEFFKHGADKAEDSYLRSKNRRISNMGSIMEAYGITENNLRDVRLKY